MAGAGAVKVLSHQGAGPRPHWTVPDLDGDVLVFEESPLVRAGLRHALEAAASRAFTVAVTSCAESPAAALPAPRVVLLDPSAPCSAGGCHARECVRQLVAAGHQVVVHTNRLQRHAALVALSVGAVAYVDQGSSAQTYEVTLRAVLDGRRLGGIPRNGDASWPTPDAALEAVPVLTARERTALVEYGTGLPLKLVGRSMGVTEYTARTYLDRVKSKYAAAGRPIHTRSHFTMRAFEDCYLTVGGHVGAAVVPRDTDELIARHATRTRG